MSKEGRYIYCLINDPEKASFKTRGMCKEAVSVINYKDLGLVFSPSDIVEYDISRENLMAHQMVMEEAMENHIVLPVRFGTIGERDEDEIIEKILEDRYEEFQKLLEKMSGKMELGLKALWKDIKQIYEEIVETCPDIKKLKTVIEKKPPEKTRNLRMAIGEMVKSALEDKKEAEKERILTGLEKLSFDFNDNSVSSDRMILNTAFLVEKDKEKEFSREIERLAAQYEGRVSFKYVGPVPPCNFIEITITW
ncbi:MAG: GvpL/GvpF family gas vesicle protein [Chloroflexi bacterium]|nr:GvpL/GvpF family gas vesicle protein [Chloroflexota bacterium]